MQGNLPEIKIWNDTWKQDNINIEQLIKRYLLVKLLNLLKEKVWEKSFGKKEMWFIRKIKLDYYQRIFPALLLCQKMK